MTNLSYTPDQISSLTLPQLMCLLSKKPPDGRTMETAADYRKVVEEESRREKEWFAK